MYHTPKTLRNGCARAQGAFGRTPPLAPRFAHQHIGAIHAYGQGAHVRLLQLAHAFMQLLARSDLIAPVERPNLLASYLIEALCNQALPEELFGPDLPRFQIRFVEAPT